ncbi:Signaling mucin MSB2 like protein [Verticillium longisporum]|uniref:Signaling mucin MSB2 like protein n=1 Tax=Verticillium longisporum TaxID=100787 RepID=A0A8I2ZQ24_VERLO|nr:Signaling mucin MSB2 like protein [Verticillium longisporum]
MRILQRCQRGIGGKQQSDDFLRRVTHFLDLQSLCPQHKTLHSLTLCQVHSFLQHSDKSQLLRANTTLVKTLTVKSVLLGAALALATTTMAETDKPRIYFPRHVKRQFTNSTLSQPGTFPPAPETPPLTSRTDTPTFITSLRQSLTNDLIDPAESSPSSSESLSEPSDTTQRTTVVISSTIRVPPTTVPKLLDSNQSSSEELSASDSTAPQHSPSSSNTETSTSQTTAEPEAITASGTTTNEAATTIAASETTTAASETTTAAAEKITAPSETTTAASETTTAAAETTTAPSETTTAAAEKITAPSETTTAPSETTTAAAETTTAPSETTTAAAETTTAPSETTTAAAETTTVPSETTTAAAETTTAPSETTTVPSETTTAPSETTAVTLPEQSTSVKSVSSAEESGTGLLPTSSSTTAEVESTTSIATTEAQTSAEPTSSEIVTTSSGIVIAPTGLVTPSSSEPPTSAVTSILSVPTNSTESEIESTQTATTALSGSTVAVSATTTASVPITTDASEPPVSANTTITDQSTLPTVSLTSLPPGGSSIVSSTSIFPGSSVISVSPSASGEASVAPNTTETVPTASASIPITEPSSSVSVTSILESSTEPTAATSSLPTDLPTSSVPPDSTTVVFDKPLAPPHAPSVSASGEPSTTAPVTSLAPTNTITGTGIWLPSTIIVENSTPTRAATDAVAPTSGVALPSDLPKVGFLYAENYEFVSKNPMAAAQLFTLLPIALTDGAKIDAGKVIVTSLVPYDTMPSLGYITTLARFWYPASMVDQLRMDIKIPNSLLHNNPQQLIYNLTQNINPAIDIIPGSENIPGGNGGAPTSGSPNGNNDMFDNNESDSTPIQTGTAAAIGIGAVTVGVAYGAAMFLIARRYKRKKQAHRRASSISGTSSDMRYTGTGSPAMMGGALMSRDFSNYGGVAGGRDSHGSGRTGNSGRTAKISAPVAAENSLGWN